LLTQDHELAAHAADRLAVVFAEISDGLESGISRPVSHITSTLRCASFSDADWIGHD